MSNPTVTLKGRIATQPELRPSKDGKFVTTLTIVTDRRKKDANDQWTSVEVTWWRCVAFDAPLAENIAEYMEKGMAVIAEGTAYQDDWTDKDGNTRTSLKCTLSSIGEDLKYRKRGDETSPAKQASSFDEPPPF